MNCRRREEGGQKVSSNSRLLDRLAALSLAAVSLAMPLTLQASAGQSKASNPLRVAVEPASASSDATLPTLSEVVEKALTAYGGKASLNQMLVNVTFFGTQSGGDNPRPLTFRRMRKGEKWRIDLDPAETTEAPQPSPQQPETAAPPPPQTGAAAPKQGVMLGFDGSDGWECANNETSTLGPDKVAWLTQEEIRQPSLLANWEEKGYSFVFKGKTEYKNQPVYALEITQEGETPTTLYLDTNNYLVNGLTYEMPVTSGDEKSSSKSTVVLDYGEYQPTCNTLWPFKISETVNGKTASEMKLTAVNAITAIADSAFARPNLGAVYHLPKPVTVPFEYVQKEIIVKGRMNNGEEVNFLFDTGASDTIIDRRAAAQHFLAKEERYDIAAVSGMVSASSSQIDRLELGNMILNNLKARIFDLSAQSRTMGRPIAGVIGTNVISRFLVTLDYGRQTITFADIDSAARPSSASALTFTQKQAPYVKATFNGKDQYTMLMDTGAAFNHIPTTVAHNYLKNDPAHVKHVTEGTGLDGRPVQLGQVMVESVAVSNLALHRVVFTYPIKTESKAQQQAQREGGFFQVANLGILGNPYWENFVITIDYKYGRLLLVPN
ncbi:MAG TPA: retroviral-like aspartic protease family protein, partial [Chroococcales cyanobacterium]